MLGVLSTAAPSKLAQFEIVRRLGAGGMAEVFLAKKRGRRGHVQGPRRQAHPPDARRLAALPLDVRRGGAARDAPQPPERRPGLRVLGLRRRGAAPRDGVRRGLRPRARSCRRAKAKGTRIPPWVAAWIIAEAAKGLHYAHEKKDEARRSRSTSSTATSRPQNILLSFEGAVKIADFGIASAQPLRRGAGVLKGKFGYMSPEQARGEKVDRRSDLYALGVILWEILTGRPLHGGLGGEALLDIVRSGIVEPPTHVRAGRAARARGDRDARPRAAREDRFPTGRELAGAIARAIWSSRSSSTRRRSRRRSRSSCRATRAAPTASRRRSRRGSAATTRGRRRPCRSRASRRASRASGRSGRGASPRPRRASAPRAPLPRARARPDGPREVRHVAVVTLRLARRSTAPGARRARTLDQLRAMLDDIAYKRGHALGVDQRRRRARHRGARRPTRRAPPPTPRGSRSTSHEAIAGFKEDLPRPLGASIGIVRGIATRHARPAGAPRPLRRCTIPATYLADVLGDATPLGPHLGRRRRLPPRAPRLPLGRRAERSRSTRRARRRRAADDAHLRARAEPLARGAPGRGAGGAERSRRPRRREGRPPRRVPRGGERRRRRRAARLRAPSSARWASARRRSSRRSSPSSRRTRASSTSSARRCGWRCRTRRSPSSCATRSARPARSRSTRWRRSSRARAAARRRGDASSPMVARLAELATNRHSRRRRRGRARTARRSSSAGVRNLLGRDRAGAAARARHRGPAVGATRPSLELLGEHRAQRATRCRSSCCSSRDRTTACSHAARGHGAHRAARPLGGGAGAPRRDAPRRARRRAAGLRRAPAARRRQPVLPARDGRRAARARRARDPRDRGDDGERARVLARTERARRGLRRAALDARAAPRRPPPRAARPRSTPSSTGSRSRAGPLVARRPARSSPRIDRRRGASCASARAGSAIARASSSTSATR